MSTPPAPPLTDAERKVEDLEQIGRRLTEEQETLSKQSAYLDAEIEHHNAELVRANDALGKLPKDAGATVTFEAKSTVVAIELNTGLLKEQVANLQPELSELPGLIKANADAIKAAKAELP